MATAKKTAESQDSPETETQETPKVASGKVVAYIGTADARIISANDFKSLGIEDQTQLVWDRGNKFQVGTENISDSALKYLDEDDDGFVVKDVQL